MNISKAVKNFQNDEVVAVGGRLLVKRENSGQLEAIQFCEYMKTFQLSRRIFARLNAQCLISGAFGVFRKSALLGICIGSNRTDDIGGIHRYREKYEEPFEMDTKTDFNNNRRDGFANSDYGSEGSWNAYIPLAKTCLVDLIFSQYCRV